MGLELDIVVFCIIQSIIYHTEFSLEACHSSLLNSSHKKGIRANIDFVPHQALSLGVTHNKPCNLNAISTKESGNEIVMT